MAQIAPLWQAAARIGTNEFGVGVLAALDQ
ncbi:hypothetical protein GGQ66_001128 [Rhizobium borbori]|uniref:Uncharacterized protein n=1 Tax=Allorhizobium borbori TaxID=485907 RepID=A0A7W6P0L2_9HYPH|nr:hypothetical protein [Allorhizobium borbori]